MSLRLFYFTNIILLTLLLFDISYSKDNLKMSLFDEDKLSSMSLKELRLHRSEIYARYGYVFNNPFIQNLIKELPWYSPNPDISQREIHKMMSKNTILYLKNLNVLINNKYKEFKSSENSALINRLSGNAKTINVTFSDLLGDGDYYIVCLYKKAFSAKVSDNSYYSNNNEYHIVVFNSRKGVSEDYRINSLDSNYGDYVNELKVDSFIGNFQKQIKIIVHSVELSPVGKYPIQKQRTVLLAYEKQNLTEIFNYPTYNLISEDKSDTVEEYILSFKKRNGDVKDIILQKRKIIRTFKGSIYDHDHLKQDSTLGEKKMFRLSDSSGKYEQVN